MNQLKKLSFIDMIFTISSTLFENPIRMTSADEGRFQETSTRQETIHEISLLTFLKKNEISRKNVPPYSISTNLPANLINQLIVIRIYKLLNTNDSLNLSRANKNLYNIAKTTRIIFQNIIQEKNIPIEGMIKRIIDSAPSIQNIDFSFCSELTDDHLAQLPKTIKLKSLNLTRCLKLTDKVFCHLPAEIYYLNISSCFQFSKNILAHLPKKLKFINVSMCLFSNEELGSLSKGVKIIYHKPKRLVKGILTKNLSTARTQNEKNVFRKLEF